MKKLCIGNFFISVTELKIYGNFFLWKGMIC